MFQAKREPTVVFATPMDAPSVNISERTLSSKIAWLVHSNLSRLACKYAQQAVCPQTGKTPATAQRRQNAGVKITKKVSSSRRPASIAKASNQVWKSLIDA